MTDVADLERRIGNLELRVNWLDEHGTRGVGALQIQVTQLVRDVTKVEERLDRQDAELDRRFDDAERKRAASRRWAWGWAIAAVIALETPLITLLAQRH